MCENQITELPAGCSSGADQVIQNLIIQIIPEGESDRQEDPEEIQTVILTLELELPFQTKDFREEIQELLEKYFRESGKIFDLQITKD